MSQQNIPFKNVPMTARDSVTATQINNVLNVAAVLYPYLANPPDSDPLAVSAKTDGEARAAALVTFFRACDRLEKILDDDPRWELRTQDTLEKALEEMYRTNTAFFVAQTRAADAVSRPSFMYRPTLIRADGCWAAVLGNQDDLKNAVVGVGRTPEAAYVDFDAVFAGQTEAQMLYLDDENETERNSQVDGRAGEPTKGAKSRRRASRRDSQKPGPDPGGSIEQAGQSPS